MTSKKVLATLQNIPWEQARLLKCLHCLDTRTCRICKGAKVLPEPYGAAIRSVTCWSCDGTGICPHCAEGHQETA